MLLLKFLTLLTTFQYRQKSIQGSQALSLLLLCMILFLFNEIFNFPLKTKSFNIIYYIIKVELQIHHCIKLLHRTNNLLIINCYFILFLKKKKTLLLYHLFIDKNDNYLPIKKKIIIIKKNDNYLILIFCSLRSNFLIFIHVESKKKKKNLKLYTCERVSSSKI